MTFLIKIVTPGLEIGHFLVNGAHLGREMEIYAKYCILGLSGQHYDYGNIACVNGLNLVF